MESSSEEPLESPKRAKHKKDEAESYEELATLALSRARALLRRAEGGAAADPMVDFMLQSAQVLATLELAAAIRSATSAPPSA